MNYDIANITNFITSYDKSKTNLFHKILRYADYRRIKKNIYVKDIDKRPTYNLISEFMYYYKILNKLLRLSENKDYNFISIQEQKQVHKSENPILTNNYNIYIIKVKLPDMEYVISLDNVLKEVEFTVDSNQTYTVVGESNDYSAYVLDITQYVCNRILEDYWDIDMKKLNKSPISIIDMNLSSLRVDTEYNNQREYFSIDNTCNGCIYIDNRNYATIVSVKGCVSVYDIYYKYECNIIIDYIQYDNDKDSIFPYIIDYLESKRKTIRDKLEFAIFSCTWDHYYY